MSLPVYQDSILLLAILSINRVLYLLGGIKLSVKLMEYNNGSVFWLGTEVSFHFWFHKVFAQGV